jgi:hypothetical protein
LCDEHLAARLRNTAIHERRLSALWILIHRMALCHKAYAKRYSDGFSN